MRNEREKERQTGRQEQRREWVYCKKDKRRSDFSLETSEDG